MAKRPFSLAFLVRRSTYVIGFALLSFAASAAGAAAPEGNAPEGIAAAAPLCVIGVSQPAARKGTCLASWWYNALSSRKRIIQLTLLAVILGVFILQWRRT